MTLEHFKNSIDGAINDYTDGATDGREFRDAILDTVLDIAKRITQLEQRLADSITDANDQRHRLVMAESEGRNCKKRYTALMAENVKLEEESTFKSQTINQLIIKYCSGSCVTHLKAITGDE